MSLIILLLSACGNDVLTDPTAASRSAASAGSGRTRIIFFGDSITEAGVYPNGYVTIFRRTLQYLNPGRRIEVLGAGVSGNRVPHLLARLQRDVLSEEPTHVVIYVGVNDVGLPSPPGGNTGVNEYRRGLSDLVTRINEAGAEAVVCTPGLIGEDPGDDTGENQLLDRYAGVVKEVAAVNGAPVCDLRAAFTGYLERFNPGGRFDGILTSDGIHLNESGNRFVARQLLHTFSTAFEEFD